ncbi:MAG: NAD(P) transhydrogenase subunit alpha [Treponema sp.]|nr:NAD(P) transhydrogenase subunit alpha [Treponema sp.]
MIIGIPKEIMQGERRVSAIPETVSLLIKDGAKVLVESGAGTGAFFSDERYTAAGAIVVDDAEEIYSKAEVILKVKEPQFNRTKNRHEVDMMHKGQFLITFLHPASPANHEMIRNLAVKGVTGLTLDSIPRITRAQSMDALTSMSTCAGYKGMIMAMNDLKKFVPQIFCAAGAIKPCNVLVIGTGVSGLQAIATAKRAGAVVYAADIRPDAAEQAKSVGAKPVPVDVPAEFAAGKGGYAAVLPQEWLVKEQEALAAVIPQMDIVFCGALVPGKKAPVLVTEDIVRSMTPGSVIVDISIDQGGNCAITSPGEVCVKHGITINGIKNIPGLIPASSAWMFAYNIYNLVKYLAKDGNINLDRNDEIVASVLTSIDGKVVHSGALEAMGL